MRVITPLFCWIKLLVFLLPFLLVQGVSASNTSIKPRVVSSIKPLQLLVAAVAGDLVDSQLLLPATVSPHLYHLRPSDQLLLQSADLVIWVGPDIESFLVKTLSLLPRDHSIELGRVLGRASERLSDTASLGAHRHSEYSRSDAHIWLNPSYAVQMARVIADRLIEIDPNNHMSYQQNWDLFRQRVDQADQQIRTELQSLFGQRYIVLHDAYGHFEQRYGLQHVGALTVSPDRKPGLKGMLEIKEKVQTLGVHCLFREPQYQSAIEKMIVSDKEISLGLLDPLASTIVVSKVAYVEFLLSFSAEFQRCLSQ